jgi:hypothetical protein
MNRRSVFTLSAITALGLAMLPSSIVAQQGTLRQQLVGNWTLVSEETTAQNGTKEQPYGPNPRVILMLDASGRYAIGGGRPDRPKFKSPSQPTTEELGVAVRAFGATFGTWSVSEADKTLTQHLESALRPNNEGTDVKNSVSLVGDELKLSGVSPATGVRFEKVFRRAR